MKNYFHTPFRSPCLLRQLILGCLLVLASANTLYALDCTNSNSFTCSPLPTGGNWQTGGNSVRTNTDTSGNWLQLTHAGANQVGFTYFNQPFLAGAGFTAEFEFSASNGSTYQPADGLVFFLFKGDGSFTPGYAGGNLGYRGLGNAYLGAGFDLYGGFRSAGTRPYVSSKNHIVIRGSQVSGYPYIASKKVENAPFSTKNSTRNPFKVTVSFLPTNYERNNYRAHVSLTETNTSRNWTLDTLITEKPFDTLRLGFVAATGEAHARQEVRNVKVTHPVDLSVTGKIADIASNGEISYELTAAHQGNYPDNNASLSVTLPEYLELTQPLQCRSNSNCKIRNTVSDTQVKLDFSSTNREIALILKGRVKPGAKQGGNLTAKITTSTYFLDPTPNNNQVIVPIRLLTGKVMSYTSGNLSPEPHDGRPMTTKVLLFKATTDIPDRQNSPLLYTYTNESGEYAFPSRPEHAYWIAAASTRRIHTEQPDQVWSGSGGLCSAQKNGTEALADAGYCFGGRQAGHSDPFRYEDWPWLDEMQHIIKVVPEQDKHPVLTRHHLDFGFSYDVVTHTNDNGQGSVRQFIWNALTESGSGNMLFVPVTPKNTTHGWKTELLSPLPSLSKTHMTLDGRAWNYLSPQRRALSTENAKPGITAGAQQTTLPSFLKPDLELNVLHQQGASVILLDADHLTVSNLAVSVSDNRNQTYGIHASSRCTSCTINHNVIGIPAHGVLDTTQTLFSGIQTESGSEVIIDHNWIEGTRQAGINFRGSGSIHNNLLLNNATLASSSDAISLEGNISDDSRLITISDNHINGASGIVLEGWRLLYPKKLIISGNTLAGAGQKHTMDSTGTSIRGEGAGIRLMAINDSTNAINVFDNRFEQNNGPGVVIAHLDGNHSSRGNKITQNHFIDNTSIPIDLDSNPQKKSGDGVTENTGVYVLSGARSNEGIDRPIIHQVLLDEKRQVITIKGFAMPGVFLEFYQKHNNEYVYHLTQQEGNSEDKATDSAYYTDPVSQTRIQQNKFQFELPASRFSASDSIVAVAFDNKGNTSEFSNHINTQKSSSLLVTLWKDTNKNGVKDNNEMPLGKLIVQLYQIDNSGQQIPITHKITDLKGELTMSGLLAGQYKVEISPDQPALKDLIPGKNTPNPQTITLNSGESGKLFFGYINPTEVLQLTPNHHRMLTPGVQSSFSHTLRTSLTGRFAVSYQWNDPAHPDKKMANDHWPVIIKSFYCETNQGMNTAGNIITIGKENKTPNERTYSVCLKAGFFIPANTAYGVKRTLALKVEQVPEVSDKLNTTPTSKKELLTATVINDIAITEAQAGKLTLNKWVTNISQEKHNQTRSNKASPGDILEYTIVFTNTGTAPVTDIAIADQTPPFSTLLKSIACADKKPDSIQCDKSTFNSSYKGYRGELNWPFKGTLQPDEQGIVSYQVKIE
ncbi:hypothetical protein CI610_00244 [invertebrate metagenome]|uniref:DUF11 domain-containing protein n=1 Tax=invertebrate metagenome TaxID=1711999 RepID=A0A2H9TBY6_9ZZZZ